MNVVHMCLSFSLSENLETTEQYVYKQACDLEKIVLSHIQTLILNICVVLDMALFLSVTCFLLLKNGYNINWGES